MEHDAVRPLFAINHSLDMDCFIMCDGPTGNADWSYSAWDSAASSFVLAFGLLVKLYTSIDTCFNFMFLARLLCAVHLELIRSRLHFLL